MVASKIYSMPLHCYMSFWSSHNTHLLGTFWQRSHAARKENRNYKVSHFHNFLCVVMYFKHISGGTVLMASRENKIRLQFAPTGFLLCHFQLL